MKVQICSRCDGTGEIREDVGGHQSEYEYHVCNECNGTGRVKSLFYTLTVPFDFDIKTLYDIDRDIMKLINSANHKNLK